MSLVCDTDWIRKKKYTFLRLFGRIFFKEFLAHNVLGHLAKLKRGLGLGFEAHFLQDFSIKMFFNSLSVDKVSMPIVGPLLPQSPPVIKRMGQDLPRIESLRGGFQNFA